MSWYIKKKKTQGGLIFFFSTMYIYIYIKVIGRVKTLNSPLLRHCFCVSYFCRYCCELLILFRRHSFFKFTYVMIIVWILKLKECSYFLYKIKKYIVCIRPTLYMPFLLAVRWNKTMPVQALIATPFVRISSNNCALRRIIILFRHSHDLCDDSNNRKCTHVRCVWILYGYSRRFEDY